MKVKYDWNEKIKEYKSSGLGVTARYKTQNIPDSTLSYHLHKKIKAKSPGFIELEEKPSNITHLTQGKQKLLDKDFL